MSTESTPTTTHHRLTIADLDRAVHEVERLKSAAAISYWQLGKKILEVHEAQLWKLRTNDDGSARYKGFEAFARDELKMHHSNAYALLKIAQTYTEEDVARFGTTKLGLLLQAPPQDRPKLQEQAESMSTRELEREVRKRKAATDYQRPAKTKLPKNTARKPHNAVDKITIAKIEGRKTVKLYAKPASLRDVNFDELKRAKKMPDRPFGRFELANDVVMYIALQDQNGELVAVVDTRREAL